MKKIYKRFNETGHVRFNPPERTKVCSLRNSIEVKIEGKLFCLAHIGQKKHKDALQSCQKLNATLPLPKSFKENHHFIESLERLGIDKKMNEFSTKIVLDVQRFSKKGKVIKILVFSLYVNCLA